MRPTAFFKSVSGQFGELKGYELENCITFIYSLMFSELLQQGWPFVMFGDGEICKYVQHLQYSRILVFRIHLMSHITQIVYDAFLTRCNPISETDLAAYMLNCVEDETKWNKILNLGGPDDGMTMKEQGEMIFSV